MSERADHSSSGAGRAEVLAPLLSWTVGMSVVFHRMILSGLQLIHGGLGDGRLINYTLEHSFRWLIQSPAHEKFWNAPLFYPQPNITAYADVMLGVGPFFWVWRAIGLEPDTSFQLWLLIVWSLNFVLAYIMLARCFGIGPIAASLGAYLFAFGNPQVGHWYHPQLAPKFYVLLAVISLFGMFSRLDDATVARRRRIWIAVFFSVVVLQAYSAWYVFFFFGLLLTYAIVWALSLSDTRQVVLGFARQHWVSLCIAGALAALALAPLIQHYLITAEDVGMRRYHEENVPRWSAWLATGGRNYVYGWLQREGPFSELRDSNQSNGIGMVTLAVSLFGLIAGWRNRVIRVILLATGTLIISATMFGGFSLWRLVYAWVPGAAAIRAIGRIGMVVALPASIGLALAFQRFLTPKAGSVVSHGRYALVAALALICMVEQLQRMRWIDKQMVRDQIDEIAEIVDPQCEAFLLVCTGPDGYRYVNDDAAWVQLATGIPTINGRFGNRPRGYRVRRFQMPDNPDKEGLRRALDHWIATHGLDPARICWVEYTASRAGQFRR